jgi:ABC-type glutathione transport system ATPase component
MLRQPVRVGSTLRSSTRIRRSSRHRSSATACGPALRLTFVTPKLCIQVLPGCSAARHPRAMTAIDVPGSGIVLSRLSKFCREVRAVRSIDLAVAPGETGALLGPNGAGKSTTVQVPVNVLVFGRDSGRA